MWYYESSFTRRDADMEIGFYLLLKHKKTLLSKNMALARSSQKD